MDFEKLKNVKAIVLDIDGVLTTGDILVTDEGEFLRSVNMKDGYALHRANAAGIKMCCISGSTQKGMIKRLAQIGINDVFHRCLDKPKQLEEWANLNGLLLDQIIYIGDDTIDKKCIELVGFGACPKDAVDEVKEVADYVSKYNGGRGAVRDVVETMLRLKGLWE